MVTQEKSPIELLKAKYPIDAGKKIETVEELRNHLVLAAQVELSTIPLYLYAAYSIKTSGYSQWSPGTSAFDAIRSVVVEEMLHLCLARNLLVAIGGDVRFYSREFVFSYPNDMLHHKPPLTLRLQPASVDLMRDIFMPLEMPMKAHAKPQGDEYLTLGQFYMAIEQGFKDLDEQDRKGQTGLWGDTHSALQYSRAHWGGGKPVVVKDLETACQAITTIVEQGEGAATGVEDVPVDPNKPTPGLSELSHYAKFERIADGIDAIGDVWPVPSNPYPEDFDFKGRGGERLPAANLATLFDAAYCYVLCIIDKLYATPQAFEDESPAGGESERYGIERQFLAAMGGLLFPIADLLVHQPVSPPESHPPRHAAPGFRFYEFDQPGTKKEQLLALCDGVIGHFPSLGGDDGVRQLMNRLPEV
jgi:hypothetical protein